MNMKQHNIQQLRDKYIRALSSANNSTEKAKEMADDLFALDLTVYSKNFSLNSLIYNAFSTSIIDENISLHPQQLEVIYHIENNLASIISAPTSFGKTFCIFEYIVRNYPKNIVLIVPTLALVEEYLRKIIKKYIKAFEFYKIHTSINEETVYNFDDYNIFILTHDRIVQETAYSKLEVIDFLVIDEVYKLETDIRDDRVLVLNMAYYYLAKKAQKYVLLAPFIKNVENKEALDKNPVFFNSTYSPVVNEIKVKEILNDNDRFKECQNILTQLNPNDKTLIYFPTVIQMYNYINEIVKKEQIIESHPNIKRFIEWARDEIHDEWCVITALEHGYLIHNGQIPLGTRIFQLDYYENNEKYNKLLCTSTLLEGVNTSAKNIIITKPSREPKNNKADFTAFDFFNLVGRTGRLYKHYIGDAYYIKAPEDPIFNREDAIKSIKFELTDDSKDIDIQRKQLNNHPDVQEFFYKINTTNDEYIEKIGTKVRFDTVLEIYNRYIEHKNELINILAEILNSSKPSRHALVEKLYQICEQRQNKLDVNIITQLLRKTRPKVKKVVDDTHKYHQTIDINVIISKTIKMKLSYIEHSFYNKVSIIKFFMEKDNTNKEYLNILDDRILQTIEFLYFLNIKSKKMLLDLGIYERDIDKIIKIIGDDFTDVFELKHRLLENINKFKDISYISYYVIQKLYE